MVVSRRRHLHRRLLGIQGAWLGRLLGLGSRGELLARTVAALLYPAPSDRRRTHAARRILSCPSRCSLLLCVRSLWDVPDPQRYPRRLLRTLLCGVGHRLLHRPSKWNHPALWTHRPCASDGSSSTGGSLQRAPQPQLPHSARHAAPRLHHGSCLLRYVDAADLGAHG